MCGMRVQVPMAHQGVVESLMAVLARVTGSTSEALAVQQAACGALQSLAYAADNKVRAGRGVLILADCMFVWFVFVFALSLFL